LGRRILICGLIFLNAPNVFAQQPLEKPPVNESAPPSNVDENPSPVTQHLRTFQTIRIETGTWLAKPEMCEGALQKHREFEAWDLSILRSARADVVLKIDHQPGWFYYQYSMVHLPSQVVLASGNVTAWDGKVACSKVADVIIARIKRARSTPKGKPKQRGEPKEQKDKNGKENESR
jgi:hypothetical protein